MKKSEKKLKSIYNLKSSLNNKFIMKINENF